MFELGTLNDLRETSLVYEGIRLVHFFTLWALETNANDEQEPSVFVAL